MINFEKLQKHVFVTKLAGFEHTKYIQNSQTHEKVNEDDIPLVQGKNIRNGFFIDKYDWFIRKEISDTLERSKLNKICLLIPYVGSNLGEVGIFYHEQDCHMASNIAKVELIDDHFDIEFLKYYLQSDIGQAYLFQAKQGSAQPNITMEAIRNTLVIDLDINLQRKVAKVLKTIDDKIINNYKINAELESMAKAIYDYWFLQFDFPDKNGKPYKSSGGKMVWNEELKKDIPEGWGVKKIQDILTKISKTKKYKLDEYGKGNKYPIIDQSSKYICGYTDDENELLNLEDCIIFGDHTKCVKYVNFAFARGADGTQVINSSISNLPNYVLYRQILNMDLVSQGYSRYFKFLKDKYVIVPQKNVSDSFMESINDSLNKMKHIINENRELESLRNFLLPLLMNGQVGFK